MSTQAGTDLSPTKSYRVTNTETGESKVVPANTAAGAVKVSNWPPALCRADLVKSDTPVDVFTFPERNDRGDNSALDPRKIEALIRWGDEVGLRPEMGHACIMYGAPYPTVDGLIYHAKQCDPGMRYELAHMSLLARQDIGLDKKTIAVICRVYNGNGDKIAERIGTVTRAEVTEKSKRDPEKDRYPIVSKKPIEMAENRALWDALGDAYPLGISAPHPESIDP